MDFKTKEQILSEITGIDIDRLPHDTVRASDALDAMEAYEYQFRSKMQFPKSDGIVIW